MYCRKCGNVINSNDNFCSYCGCEGVNDNGNRNVNGEEKSNISIILGILAVMMLWLPFVCIPLAIAGIVIGVKNKKYDNRNTGIILGVVSLILSIIYIIVIVGFTFFAFHIAQDEFDDIWDWTADYFEDESESSVDLSGERYQVSDGGVLYFDKSMSYNWYMDDNNHNDNYFVGTYEVYNGMDAVQYISTNLSKYGITMEEQFDLFYGKFKYEMENYYLFIFDCTYQFVDGVGSNRNDRIPYYGFYDEEDEYFDMINMVTGEKFGFTLMDDEIVIDGHIV